MGVQLMLHSFYNARQKAGFIHAKIMPPTVQGHAGVNFVFVSMNNSSAPHSWQSRFITPDGLVAAELPLDQPGVMANLVNTGKKFYDAAGPSGWIASTASSTAARPWMIRVRSSGRVIEQVGAPPPAWTAGRAADRYPRGPGSRFTSAQGLRRTRQQVQVSRGRIDQPLRQVLDHVVLNPHRALSFPVAWWGR